MHMPVCARATSAAAYGTNSRLMTMVLTSSMWSSMRSFHHHLTDVTFINAVGDDEAYSNYIRV
jgi:hypothetical protein